MHHISIVSPNILFGTLSVYSNGSGAVETDDNTSASAVGAGFATSRLVHYKNNFVILQKNYFVTLTKCTVKPTLIF
jgi:hypothetical protein